MSRRRFAVGCAAAGALLANGTSLAADAYPSKPIQLFVSFGPGGVGDIVARLIAKELGRSMGQAVIVENRPTPNLAPSLVARAKPDGYTLALTGNGTALTASLFRSLSYDLLNDFVHVSTLAFFDLALITDDPRLRRVGDVIAFAKTNPGKLNIGTARLGSTQNLAAELFKSLANIDVVIVPYRSAGDLFSAIRSKDVQVAFEIVPPIYSQITSGNVRALGIASTKRFAGWPDIPTIAESGVPGFEATSWNGISVPAKTPPAIVERLSSELQRVLALAEVQRNLQAIGIVARSSTSAEMTARVKTDIAKWGAVIKRAGIPLQ